MIDCRLQHIFYVLVSEQATERKQCITLITVFLRPSVSGYTQDTSISATGAKINLVHLDRRQGAHNK